MPSCCIILLLHSTYETLYQSFQIFVLLRDARSRVEVGVVGGGAYVRRDWFARPLVCSISSLQGLQVQVCHGRWGLKLADSGGGRAHSLSVLPSKCDTCADHSFLVQRGGAAGEAMWSFEVQSSSVHLHRACSMAYPLKLETWGHDEAGADTDADPPFCRLDKMPMHEGLPW